MDTARKAGGVNENETVVMFHGTSGGRPLHLPSWGLCACRGGGVPDAPPYTNGILFKPQDGQ